MCVSKQARVQRCVPHPRCVRTAAFFKKDPPALADEPRQLATAKLGPQVDSDELLGMLRAWAFGLNSSADAFTLSLQVDSVADGVRMSLIEVEDGKIKPLVWYDLTITSVSEVEGKVFMALKDGPMRDFPLPPPDEGKIFMQLKGFLKAAIPRCTA